MASSRATSRRLSLNYAAVGDVFVEKKDHVWNCFFSQKQLKRPLWSCFICSFNPNIVRCPISFFKENALCHRTLQRPNWDSPNPGAVLKNHLYRLSDCQAGMYDITFNKNDKNVLNIVICMHISNEGKWYVYIYIIIYCVNHTQSRIMVIAPHWCRMHSDGKTRGLSFQVWVLLRYQSQVWVSWLTNAKKLIQNKSKYGFQKLVPSRRFTVSPCHLLLGDQVRCQVFGPSCCGLQELAVHVAHGGKSPDLGDSKAQKIFRSSITWL